MELEAWLEMKDCDEFRLIFCEKGDEPNIDEPIDDSIHAIRVPKFDVKITDMNTEQIGNNGIRYIVAQ